MQMAAHDLKANPGMAKTYGTNHYNPNRCKITTSEIYFYNLQFGNYPSTDQEETHCLPEMPICPDETFNPGTGAKLTIVNHSISQSDGAGYSRWFTMKDKR